MKLSDFATLALAQAETVTQPKMIHRDTMNSLLADAGIYVALKQMALDNNNPFQNNIAAFLDSTDYNFMIGDGTTTGDRQLSELDIMIASGGAMGAAIAAIRPIILRKANPLTFPFKNATEHTFKLAKGTIERLPIFLEKGFARITTTRDCVLHNPQITHMTTFDDGLIRYDRVAGFIGVSAAGPYVVKCPNLPDLFIDDPYGVIS
jgi:hypothetical protein